MPAQSELSLSAIITGHTPRHHHHHDIINQRPTRQEENNQKSCQSSHRFFMLSFQLQITKVSRARNCLIYKSCEPIKQRGIAIATMAIHKYETTTTATNNEQGLNRFYLLTIMRRWSSERSGAGARGVAIKTESNDKWQHQNTTSLWDPSNPSERQGKDGPRFIVPFRMPIPIPTPIPNRNPKSQSAALWQSLICVHLEKLYYFSYSR